ncbi:hypothetical protein CR205_06040 [Alteribacter lacisalsi]|uniref:Uncharacterized protein n=1 Tax=Alteribacter lacisalsi TaxID=2045244 RepID=A0A2W0H8G1_9BACI|nr:hypothetical protein [Alteribacter lacisalsi]PYZ98154.1 hypothetical protein CR205_06040 [Alteribacter lacisalsi]
MKKEALITALKPADFPQHKGGLSVYSLCPGTVFVPDAESLARLVKHYDRVYLDTLPLPSGRIAGKKELLLYVKHYLEALGEEYETEIIFLSACTASVGTRSRSCGGKATSVQMYRPSVFTASLDHIRHYGAWLEKKSLHTVSAAVTDTHFTISSAGLPLITMKRAAVDGNPGEGLYRITGGLLVKK